MERYYKNLYKNQLKKECSKIGLFLFCASMVMNVVTTVIMMIVMFSDFENPDNTETFLISGIASIIGIFITTLIYCKISGINLSETISMKKVSPSKFFPLIFIGFAGTFIANYIASLLNVLLTPFHLTTDLPNDYGEMGIVEFLLFAISVSIIPAIVEEFAFRGIVMGQLRKYGESFAIIVSSILFGMMHGNIAQIPFAFMVGLVLGYLTVKSNNLYPAIIVHFFNNFMSVMFTVISENKLMNDDFANLVYLFIMLILIILAIISVAFLSRNKTFFLIKKADETLTFKETISAAFTNFGVLFFTGYVILSTIYYIIVL